MSATLTQDEQQAIDQIYNYAADQLINHNKSAYELRNELEQKGLDKESSARIVSDLEMQIEEARKAKAKKDINYGALWCFGGLAVTLFSYAAASGGGRYVMAWGAIIFGGIQLVKGLVNYSK